MPPVESCEISGLVYPNGAERATITHRAVLHCFCHHAAESGEGQRLLCLIADETFRIMELGWNMVRACFVLLHMRVHVVLMGRI